MVLSALRRIGLHDTCCVSERDEMWAIGLRNAISDVVRSVVIAAGLEIAALSAADRGKLPRMRTSLSFIHTDVRVVNASM